MTGTPTSEPNPPGVVPASTGILEAFVLDGAGGGRRIESWGEVDGWRPADGLLWLNLDYESQRARAWLAERSGVDPLVNRALLASETRPRCVLAREGALLLLRGVNLNPGAEPDDMVSIRLWCEETRVVAVRIRRLVAVEDVCAAIAEGRGPASTGDLVVQLADRLVDRMADVVANVDATIDGFEAEDQREPRAPHNIQGRLAEVRRQSIILRRYLSPQREAFMRLQVEPIPWLAPHHHVALREIADRTFRYVEDLEAVRERAAVIQEELASRLAEQLNRRMYVLSLVAGIFLPVGFVTGLLGVNVGGIPGVEHPLGFLVVCFVIGLVIGLEVLLFRMMRWF